MALSVVLINIVLQKPRAALGAFDCAPLGLSVY